MGTKLMDTNIAFIMDKMGNGGAERVTSILANYFAKHGYEVSLIILTKDIIDYKINDQITLNYIPTMQVKPLRIVKRLIEISKLFKANRYDYVITLSLTGCIYIVLSGFNKKFMFITSERNDPESTTNGRIWKWLKFFCFSKADKIVFQTEQARMYFPKSIQKKGVVIPNPISSNLPNRYEGIRNKEIVTCCRLEPEKNLYMLIDAFKILLKEHADYNLSIYGRGSLRQELQEYVKRLDLQHIVVFRGFKNDIHNIIRASAMYVSSSDYEGISNSMIEALAIGLPTICTDCPAGGARMMIDSYQNGILVPVRDVNALFCAMKEVIEDSNLAQRLSINAVNIKERLSENIICPKWIE